MGEERRGGEGVGVLLVMLYRRDAHQYQHEDEQKPERGVCLGESEILHEPRIMSTPLRARLRELARHDVYKRV
jgi:hypothetical protein